MEENAEMTEREAAFLLNGAEGLYGDKIMCMRQFAGSFRCALETDPQDYVRAGILKEGAGFKGLCRLQQDRALRKRRLDMLERLPERGIGVYCYGEEDYPERLAGLAVPPPVLFVKGRLPDAAEPAAAIVGARACSSYGRNAAEYLGRELGGRGVGIVSGMAFGIDAAAAEGALKAGGKSYAVLGCGVDVCYPKENWHLYEQLCSRGAVLSEFSPGSDALGFHFLQRNRLIAALADVLIVVEAREKSGTASTVDYALELGRDVFAVPGRITEELGRGCNRLIRDGAMILTEPDDVLDHLGIREQPVETKRRRRLPALSGDEERLFSLIGSEPMHMDEICLKSGLSVREASALLCMLEVKNAVRQQDHSYYERIVF